MAKKRLCKLIKKDILDEDMEAFIKLVKDPRFICRKCGRVANSDELLCKPKKL